MIYHGLLGSREQRADIVGRGRGEGGAAGQPGVCAGGGAGTGRGTGGAVGTSGSGRRACRAPCEAWGTRVQGTARQCLGQEARSRALTAGLHVARGVLVPNAEPARAEVVGKHRPAEPQPLGRAPGRRQEGEAAGWRAPGTRWVAGPNTRGSWESWVLTHTDPTCFLSSPECRHPTGETTWDSRGRTPQFSCPQHRGRGEPAAL